MSTVPQTNPERTPSLSTIAHILSDVFSPILAPTYVIVIALWLTLLRFIPFGVKMWSLGGVFFITAVVPMLTIFLLMRLGRVSDTSISNRRERIIPYSITILCYLAAAWFLHSLNAPVWLAAFYIAAAVASVLSLAITFYWKISAHSGAIAGVTTAIYWMAIHGLLFPAPMVWVSVAILITGAVCWARLYLNHHTPLQVLAGAALSAAVVYLTLTISIL